MSRNLREQSRDRNGIALPDGWAVYYNGELVFSADDWRDIEPALAKINGEPVRPPVPGHGDADPERPLYPEVTVHLSTGHDGNIAAVMATVREAMRRAGVPDYTTVASHIWAGIFEAGSYDEALNIVMRYVSVT
jgi:hypothetical protein